MNSLSYFLFTFLGIVIIAIGILSVWFFRRLYWMIEEIDARLIQIRNLLEAGPPKTTALKPKSQPTGGVAAK